MIATIAMLTRDTFHEIRGKMSAAAFIWLSEQGPTGQVAGLPDKPQQMWLYPKDLPGVPVDLTGKRVRVTLELEDNDV
jgi:hypothetical protein